MHDCKRLSSVDLPNPPEILAQINKRDCQIYALRYQRFDKGTKSLQTPSVSTQHTAEAAGTAISFAGSGSTMQVLRYFSLGTIGGPTA